MPIHVTDICTRGLKVMAVQAGKDDLRVFFSQTICSETSQSLRIFQIFSFKLLHVSDELAPAFGLCLQSARALSPVYDKRPRCLLYGHSCFRSAFDQIKLEQKFLPSQDTLQGARAPQRESRDSISARRTSNSTCTVLHFSL